MLAAFCTVLVALAASCGEVRHSSVPSDASSDGGGSDASPPTIFFVGGHVMGLAGSGLVLQNNAADDLTITADGTFVFPAKLVSGGAFDVAVKTQPMAPKQSCVVSGGKGLVANGNVTTVAVNCTTDRFTIGGTVSGLAGAGLVLQDNAGDAIPVNANGEFAFAMGLADGSSYAVTVLTQPAYPRQTCSVTASSGKLASANVTSVRVDCVTDKFNVGGMVLGLAGTGLMLQNNGGDDRPISADGSFAFSTPLADLSSFEVTVKTQPSGPAQTCTVTGGSGTLAGSHVTSVVVNCSTSTYAVGGMVSGLVGSGLVLQNNGSDRRPVGANGTFAFATLLADLSAYAVTVQAQPTSPSQTCTVSNGSGLVAGVNVTDVVVSCVTNTYTIGGTVSGLGNGQSVVLQINGGNNLTVSANAGFTFTLPIPSGSAYMVTVLTNPPGRTCTVARSSGTVAASNVTDVAVTCIGNPCTLPWGGSINDGQSVTAYQTASAGCSGSCVSETRTCSLGVLLGTFANQSCLPPGAATSCGTNCLLYSCPGAYSFAVPAGISSINATIVGGGGGGGGGGTRVDCGCYGPGCTYVNAGGGGGGAGGAITVRASVTSGASLSLTVGASGTAGVAGGGGGGGVGGSGGTSALSGSGFSVFVNGGNGGPGSGSFGGGAGGTSSASGVTVLQNNASNTGGSGAEQTGVCDGSGSAFLVRGGAGGAINSSLISSVGGGGVGGSSSENTGFVGANGQPGAVRITW